MLCGDVDAGIAAGDVHIAAARSDGNLYFARHGNVEISLHGMIPSRFSLGVNGNQSADRNDGGLGLVVVPIGVVLIVGSNALADDYGDLVVVGCMDTDCAVRVDDLESGSGGKILLEMIAEVVGLAENVSEVAVVKVELIAHAGPVHMLDLGCD